MHSDSLSGILYVHSHKVTSKGVIVCDHVEHIMCIPLCSAHLPRNSFSCYQQSMR